MASLFKMHLHYPAIPPRSAKDPLHMRDEASEGVASRWLRTQIEDLEMQVVIWRQCAMQMQAWVSRNMHPAHGQEHRRMKPSSIGC